MHNINELWLCVINYLTKQKNMNTDDRVSCKFNMNSENSENGLNILLYDINI